MKVISRAAAKPLGGSDGLGSFVDLLAIFDERQLASASADPVPTRCSA